MALHVRIQREDTGHFAVMPISRPNSTHPGPLGWVTARTYWKHHQAVCQGGAPALRWVLDGGEDAWPEFRESKDGRVYFWRTDVHGDPVRSDDPWQN